MNMGIALFQRDGEHADALMRHAYAAMARHRVERYDRRTATVAVYPVTTDVRTRQAAPAVVHRAADRRDARAGRDDADAPEF